MYRSKRILSLPFTTLSVLFAGVILFGSTVSAEPLIETRPLSSNEQIIQQHSQKMQQKAEDLNITVQELEDLEKKKEELVKTLEAEQKLIKELKAKITEKKRVAAIRAEESANQAAYIEPEITRSPIYTPPTKRYASNSAGNTYTPGQCTWHVKNMKPELPNMLGNADMWFYNAQKQGWPVGYTARPGAAAQTKAGMHVAYVLEVYGNGTMLISEMNYNWTPYAQRTKIVSQDNYLYLY